jgi:hypothetical protein
MLKPLKLNDKNEQYNPEQCNPKRLIKHHLNNRANTYPTFHFLPNKIQTTTRVDHKGYPGYYPH